MDGVIMKTRKSAPGVFVVTVDSNYLKGPQPSTEFRISHLCTACIREDKLQIQQCPKHCAYALILVRHPRHLLQRVFKPILESISRRLMHPRSALQLPLSHSSTRS